MTDPSTSMALLHRSAPYGDVLEGVWVDHGGYPDFYYPGGEECPERQYAESLLLETDWATEISQLSESSPYLAFWTVVPREPNETARHVFDRVLPEFS